MKNVIANIVVQENQVSTMEECHENLKTMRLEPEDSIYLVALGMTHDARILNEALEDPIYEFLIPPSAQAWVYGSVSQCQYDQSDIHDNANVCDDNDGDVEVVQLIGSEADQ
ncbi:hypothetical protein Tco_1575521 [Tanacetum coccineum]